MAQTALDRCLFNQSPAMASVMQAIQTAARKEGPVLLEGEPGTGKEFLARYIHYSSPRKKKPFSSLEITAVPTEFVHQELYSRATGRFGRVRGGTVLLKELWALPHNLQKRLARLLIGDALRDETPPEVYDVRVMTSSSMPLDEALHYSFVEPALHTSLAPCRIIVPPLRRRPSDIPLLTDYFLAQISAESGHARPAMEARVKDRMAEYSWPGNISELKSVVRKLVVRASEGRITEAHLQGLLPSVDDDLPLERHSLEELVRAKLKNFLNRIRGYRIEGLFAEVMARVERPLLELVLEQTRGNQLQAAKILGMNRNTLRKKIKAHGIRRIRYPEGHNSSH